MCFKWQTGTKNLGHPRDFRHLSSPSVLILISPFFYASLHPQPLFFPFSGPALMFISLWITSSLLALFCSRSGHSSPPYCCICRCVCMRNFLSYNWSSWQSSMADSLLEWLTLLSVRIDAPLSEEWPYLPPRPHPTPFSLAGIKVLTLLGNTPTCGNSTKTQEGKKQPLHLFQCLKALPWLFRWDKKWIWN